MTAFVLALREGLVFATLESALCKAANKVEIEFYLK